jgi:hypothetical protein
MHHNLDCFLDSHQFFIICCCSHVLSCNLCVMRHMIWALILNILKWGNKKCQLSCFHSNLEFGIFTQNPLTINQESAWRIHQYCSLNVVVPANLIFIILKNVSENILVVISKFMSLIAVFFSSSGQSGL